MDGTDNKRIRRDEYEIALLKIWIRTESMSEIQLISDALKIEPHIAVEMAIAKLAHGVRQELDAVGDG
jgi:hypothetical protein